MNSISAVSGNKRTSSVTVHGLVAADIAVRHLARDADFAAETFQHSRIARRRGRQKFQRDWLLELQVMRAVDLTL